MTSLSLSELLAAPTLRPGKVPTPEIREGSFAFVAQLTADERDLLETQWGRSRAESRSPVGFRAFVVAWCLCDDHNVRQLNPGDLEDEIRPEFLDQCEAIGRQHAAALSRMFDLACAKNGLSKEDVKALEKNYESPTSDAGSGA
jgi:hypothetical protein